MQKRLLGRTRYLHHKKASSAAYSAMHLRKAFCDNQFILHYQPQFNLQNGELRGGEALIRWNHPKQGILLPHYFLEHIKNANLAIKLSFNVLNLIKKHLAQWEQSDNLPPYIAINFSAQCFNEPILIRQLLKLVHRYSYKGVLFEVEITEAEALDLDAQNLKYIFLLQAQGVSIAIDDLGNAYSSLAWLAKLPVDTVKISSEFIGKMQEHSRSRIVIESVIELGHKMGCSVVAEGIETLQQYMALKNYGCDYGQGYYFKRPTPHNEVLFEGYNKAVVF